MDPDYLSLFGGDSGAAQSQAQALAAAMRQRRNVGTVASLLGGMSGDQGMQGFGKEQTGASDKLEQGLIGAAQHRASQDIQRQHLDVEGKRLDAMLGFQQGRLDQGQQRIDAMNKALELRGIRYNPNTGTFENVARRGAPPRAPAPVPPKAPASVLPGATQSTPPATPGSLLPQATGAGQSPGMPAAGGKILDKRLKDLGADFNPSGGRAGEFGKNQARVNAATRLLQLATDENGNAKDLNPQQMPELSQALASLISGGGAGAMAQIEHLTPKSMSGDYAKVAQWLTNEPHGAGQTAFVKNMVETAQRERNVAQQGIDQVRGQLAQKHQMVLRGNPNEARRVLQGFGWDLDGQGNVVQQKGAPSTPSPAAQISPADQAAIQWAQAHPQDPRAAKIMALHGGAR